MKNSVLLKKREVELRSRGDRREHASDVWTGRLCAAVIAAAIGELRYS
jgi:hypothetical protein